MYRHVCLDHLERVWHDFDAVADEEDAYDADGDLGEDDFTLAKVHHRIARLVLASRAGSAIN